MKTRAVLALFALTHFLAVSEALGQCTTTVPGGTISGQTWTAVGSPFCVEGDVVVNSLQIQSDVVVYFTGDFSLTVEGRITAIGTGASPIVFTKNPENEIGWRGIQFMDSLPGSELAHVIVEGSINGGIQIYNSTPIIRDSVIRNNFCRSRQDPPECNRLSEGAGIYTNTDLTLTRCAITDNLATNFGGIGNTVRAFGAGIFADAGADLELIDSFVTGNEALTSAGGSFGNALVGGGGIYAAGGQLTLARTVVDSNATSQTCNFGCPGGLNVSRGGGIYLGGLTMPVSGPQPCPSAPDILCRATLVNSVVTRNSAITPGAEGGGVRIEPGWDVEIIHTTIANNAPDGLKNDGGLATAVNSIFWENSGSEIVGEATVTYSDVMGGLFPGEGNMSLNPVFSVPTPTDPQYDVHIDPTVSPAIDMGTADFPELPDHDIDGDERPSGRNFDMGADEVPVPEPSVMVLRFSALLSLGLLCRFTLRRPAPLG